MKSFKISLALIFGIILTLGACNSKNSKPAENDKVTANTNVENKNTNLKKAPQFEVTTINGENVSLQKSIDENKATVIYFTASWCPMCAQNWPALSEVYPEYKDRINLVSISIDPTDDEDVMRKLKDKNNFQFPVAPGNPQVMLDFGVDSQATTVGVNREGYVVFQKDKAVLTADEYRSLFEQLLD